MINRITPYIAVAALIVALFGLFVPATNTGGLEKRIDSAEAEIDALKDHNAKLAALCNEALDRGVQEDEALEGDDETVFEDGFTCGVHRALHDGTKSFRQHLGLDEAAE